jgi:hypothetical protein
MSKLCAAADATLSLGSRLHGAAFALTFKLANGVGKIRQETLKVAQGDTGNSEKQLRL